MADAEINIILKDDEIFVLICNCTYPYTCRFLFCLIELDIIYHINRCLDNVLTKQRRSPTDWAEFWCKAGLDQDGLERRFISKSIGYGVFTTRDFNKGDFLLEYNGEHISESEANKREKRGNCYIFGFRYNGKYHWVDASHTISSRLCGLVNDAENGTQCCNSKMKLKIIKGYPRLCLFATKNLSQGEEVRYDYGEDSEKLHWRHKQEHVNNLDEMDDDDDPFDVEKDKLKQLIDHLEVTSDEHSIDDNRNVELASNRKSVGDEHCIDDQVKKHISDEHTIEVRGEKHVNQEHAMDYQATFDFEKDKLILTSGKGEHINSRGCSTSVPPGCRSPIGVRMSIRKRPRNSIQKERFYESLGAVSDELDDSGDESYCPDSSEMEESDLSSEEITTKKKITLKPEKSNQPTDESFKPVRKMPNFSKGSISGFSTSVSQGMITNEVLDDDSDDGSYSSDRSETESEDEIIYDNGKIYGSEIDENEKIYGSESDETVSDIFPVLKPIENITFLSATKNSKGNLSNKEHACVYCEKVMPNIARHLSLKHHKEVEVAKVLMFPKKSKQRRKAWEVLVNRGDFCHNFNVLERGRGTIIPKYRHQETVSITLKDYVPCEHCKGYYKKTDLWKHQKYCVNKDLKKTGNSQHVRNGLLLLPIKNSPTELSHNVLVNMKDDDVKMAVTSDKRILDMGNRLYQKHGHEPHKIQYISQKMRELGRLLICCKSNCNSISSIDDILQGKNWNLLIKCARLLSGYKEDHSYAKPSLALKIGHSLKKCAKYMRSEGLKENNRQKEEEANRFLELYDLDWRDEISSQALTSLEEKKYNRPQLLPLTRDVVKFDAYLKEKATSLCKDIEENADNYSKLANVCLAQVILFNRKRSGEAERITLKGFKEAEATGSGKPEPVVLKTLTEFEKRLCNTHTRVEIKGKRGRRVPVLFTEEMKKNINVLIENRERANVAKDFLFAKPGICKFPYRGSDCLRKLSKEAEVENRSAFTSTLLRKQLATLAQILNLSETSQDILATFQGHDIRVHRQFYRLPENVLQAAKVTKILHSINNGSIGKFKGKDFDEIEFDENETVVDEIDSDDPDGECGDLEEDEHSDMEVDEEIIDDHSHKTVKHTEYKNKVAEGGKNKKAAGNGKNIKAPVIRHLWTKEEKAALDRQFRKNINLEKVPCQLECLNAMKKESCLEKFSWKNIKFAVKNLISSRKRLPKTC